MTDSDKLDEIMDETKSKIADLLDLDSSNGESCFCSIHYIEISSQNINYAMYRKIENDCKNIKLKFQNYKIKADILCCGKTRNTLDDLRNKRHTNDTFLLYFLIEFKNFNFRKFDVLKFKSDLKTIEDFFINKYGHLEMKVTND